MKVTFLGTGTSQGVPVIACNCEVCKSKDSKDKRLRSSVLIETNSINIVIDSGPDFRQQMIQENVSCLDAILFTHEHRDHMAGLDDVRAFNYVLNRPMDVYAETRVHRAIRKEYPYVFNFFKYPGIPEIKVHHIKNKPFKIKHIEIIPIRALHYRLPIFGFRIGDFAYLTDANNIRNDEKEKLKGLKYFVVTALRKKQHISHYSLDESIKLIHEIQPESAYLTHISHQMGLYDKVQKELPPGVKLAYDGLKLEW